MEFTPGTRQHYVNVNTLIAALVIERVTGDDYEHEVARRILRPHGLRDTYHPRTATRIRGRHHRGYQAVDGRMVAVTVWSQISTWASGDLISTAADLERFTEALFAGRVVPQPYLELMFTVPPVLAHDGDDDCRNDAPATHTTGMSRLELPGGLVAYGKTGARYGYAAGIGGTRDRARTLVYSVTSTDAKSSGQNQRAMRIALAAFASVKSAS